jgi:hypothetical protein
MSPALTLKFCTARGQDCNHVSKGPLFEGGGGEGIVGAGGVIVANGGGMLGSENLAYGGAGLEIPGAHVGAGVVAFTGGIGGYAKISVAGREFGGGAYQ